MRCGICKEDSKNIVLLPIDQKDGVVGTFACLKCAEKSSVYCKKHRKPHFRFIDGATACLSCIEEMVGDKIQRKEKIFQFLQEKLPKEEFVRLKQRAEISSAMTRDSSSVYICILKALATVAVKNELTFSEVITKIIQNKSVDFILFS